jgi:hypothetical protein
MAEVNLWWEVDRWAHSGRQLASRPRSGLLTASRPTSGRQLMVRGRLEQPLMASPSQLNNKTLSIKKVVFDLMKVDLNLSNKKIVNIPLAV